LRSATGIVIWGLLAACLFSGAFAASALQAQEAPPAQFAVEGAGRITCKQFLIDYKDQNSANYQRIIGFVEGYLTAANRYEPNTFDLSPWHNAFAFGLILEKHCTGHPEDTLVSTLQRMVVSFRPIRLAKFSDLVEAGDGKTKVIVYDAILRRAQAFLKQRGLYLGAEDGVFTPAVRDAFKKFQQEKGLTPSGLPDSATLWTLLNP